mmetsp:Transcript_108243/g.316592  ORF Transcript_108243/g.316592 Transcript_108243/m.316592 type:complete len:893 (+) Transcript_108243:163-2841(+)
MALAVANLLASLEDPDIDIRCAAVRTLGRGASLGDSAAVTLLIQRLEDTDEDVRLAAVEGLARVALGCNQLAAAPVISRLGDADEYVRRAAASAIGLLAEPGDKTAIAALVMRLGDDDEDVRNVSANSIVQLTSHGISYELAMERLLPLLQEESGETRRASAEVMARLARRGDSVALDAVLSCLTTDIDAIVRCAAAHAAAVFAEFGDPNVLALLRGCLKRKACETASGRSAGGDDDASVRSEVLGTMAVLASKGDMECLMAACNCLADPSKTVRDAAVHALVQMITPGGMAEVATSVSSFLSDEDPDVICSVIKALGVTAVSGDATIVNTVLEHFSHDDYDVRRAAVEAIGSTAVRGEADAVTAVIGRVNDSDEDVRCSAVVALAKLANPGCHQAVRTLIQALHDDDRDVRREAAASLATVAARDDVAVIAALRELLHDEEECVRNAAVDSIVKAATGEGVKIEPIFVALLGDGQASIRCTALQGLGRVVDARDCHAVERVARLLEDADEDVCEATGDALVSLSGMSGSEGQEVALQAVVRRCRHDRADVRAASLRAAARLPGVGRLQIVELLLWTLKDLESSVRETAIQLVPELKLPPASGDSINRDVQDVACVPNQSAPDVLLAGCLVQLEDPDRTVQHAATELLAAAWPSGCPAAVSAAHFRLSHQNPLIRRAALECFVALKVPRSGFDQPDGTAKAWLPVVAETTESVATCLCDMDERVRTAAVRSFEVIVKRCGGDPDAHQTVVSALLPSLNHQDAGVRCACAEALAASSRNGDEASTEMLVTLTRDADEDVRWSSVQALGKVAKRGNAAAVLAACACAKDKDDQIRIAAIQTLAAIAVKGDTQVLALLKECLNGTSDVVRVTMHALLALYPDKTAADALSGGGVV